MRNQEIDVTSIINALPHPFYVIDVETHTVVMANQAASDVGIVPQSKCYKVTHHQDTPCNSKNHPCPISLLEKAGNLAESSVTVEHVHIEKDNEKHIIEITAHPIKDENGKITQILEYAVDITDRKNAEEELEHKAQNLENLNKSLNEFTSVVSHDLKQPLTSGLGYLGLLEEELGDGLEETVQLCVSSLRRVFMDMNKLIDNLLNLSRLSSREQELELIAFDRLLDEVLSMNEDVISSRQVEILRQPLPQLTGDRIQLRQLFYNLVANALKFTDKESIVIEVGAVQKGNIWEITIKDNGIGIPETYLQKIFDPFVKLYDSHTYPGHGVGLAICRKVMELHSGTIRAESIEEGKGSTFIMTFPISES